MKIAVIGAGFVGLVSCWHLLDLPTTKKLTLIDRKGLGGGASGMAAGLLHAFAGAHSKYNRWGKEGIESTLELIEIAQENVGQVVAKDSGVLRPATDSAQEQDFRKASREYPEQIQWLESSECQKLIPGLAPFPGILIKPGITVNCSLYLEGLWKACLEKGATFEQRDIQNLKDLDNYDQIVVTNGWEAKRFPELSHLALTPVKGQLLEFTWPKDLPPLPLPLNSYGYLVMHPNQKSCFAGATYERDESREYSDCERAQELIWPKVLTLLPHLKNPTILGCQAAFRASTPDHLPLYGKVGKKIWYITGMGSKGLLYHALFAKRLAENIRHLT